MLAYKIESDPKMVFIGGAGHSGTTLLFKILCNHPKALSSYTETRFIEMLPNLSKRYISEPKTNIEKQDFIFKTLFLGWKIIKSDKILDGSDKGLDFQIEKGLSLESSNSFISDIKTFLKAKLQSNTKDFYLEKTPSNSYYIERIIENFPGSKIVIIHRDIRDVIASLKKRYLSLKADPKMFGDRSEWKKLQKDYNILADTITWNKIVNLSEINSVNILVIRYEDLVTNVYSNVRKICNFLDIDFNPSMIIVHNRNSSDSSLISMPGIDSASVGSWENVLSKYEACFIQNLSKSQMIRLQYPVIIYNNWIKICSLYLFPKESIKILSRIVKRFRLFTPKYFLIYLRNLVSRFLFRPNFIRSK